MSGARARALIAAVILVLAVAVIIAVGQSDRNESQVTEPGVAGPGGGAPEAGAAPPTDETGVVDHFIDGDTLDVLVRGQSLRIRLLNIDAPETYPEVECKGPEAAARLQQLAPMGSTVGLSYDVERTDQYGRTLAALILSDGRNASEVLASEGLGEAVLFEPNDRDFEAVRAAEAEAEQAGLGIYSSAC